MAFLCVSNYFANVMLDQAFRNTTWTRPGAVFLALYTSDPTRVDTGTEVIGGGYTRQVITFAAPSEETVQLYHPDTGALVSLAIRAIKNTAEIVFPQSTAAQGTITHMGIRDASTAGNLLFAGPVDNPRSVGVNDVIRFPVGMLMAGFA